MPGIVREVLNTLRKSPAEDAALRDSEELAHLDERLGGLAAAGGITRCALSVRPGDCTSWAGNLTGTLRPSAEGCRPLIDSIAKEGGNLVPVVVRPTPKGSDRPFELLVGNRRRFAVEWLNRNGRPEIRLNALVVDLSDEEAFRLADIENHERADIAELDRARSYRHALEHFYGGVQSRMAEALKLSNSQLSRMLALAELPQEIVDAFATTDELRVRHSEILTPLLRRPERALILDEAKRIGAEQEDLCSAGEKLIPAATVLARLKDAGSDGSEEASRLHGNAPEDDGIGKIEPVPGGLAVRFVVPDFANLDELLGALKEELLESRRAGRASPGASSAR